jgi:hypothetical protein
MFTLAIALEQLTNLLETKEHCLLAIGKKNQKIIKFEHYAEILNILLDMSRHSSKALFLLIIILSSKRLLKSNCNRKISIEYSIERDQCIKSFD